VIKCAIGYSVVCKFIVVIYTTVLGHAVVVLVTLGVLWGNYTSNFVLVWWDGELVGWICVSLKLVSYSSRPYFGVHIWRYELLL
jgi:hypothetical protein